MFSTRAMLAALCVTVTVSYGILWYAFTVLQTPMQKDLGWDSTTINAGASLAILVSGIVAALVGRWLDARGIRIPMSVGSVVATFGVVGWAVAQSPWLYWLAWLLIGLGRSLVVYEVAFHAVNQYFENRRAALTTLTFAGGFASVIFIPLINTLLQHWHWREVLLFLAALEFLTLPLHWFFMPNQAKLRSEASNHTPLELLRSPTFNQLSNAFALIAMGGVTLNLQTIPILIEKGYAMAFAAGIGALLGVMSLTGRLLITPLGAKIGGFKTLALLVFCQTLGSLALLLPFSWSVYAFLILYGMGFGAVAPNKSALLAECFGTNHYGRINGTMTTRNLPFQAGAPLLAGVIHTYTGSYQAVLIMICCTSLLACLLVLNCPPINTQAKGVS
jgi:MFS family permease